MKMRVILISAVLLTGIFAAGQQDACGYWSPGNPRGCQVGSCHVTVDLGMIMDGCQWPEPCPRIALYNISECCGIPVNWNYLEPTDGFCWYTRLQQAEVQDKILALADAEDFLVPTCTGTLMPVQYVLQSRRRPSDSPISPDARALRREMFQ
jgi:hypothetical protein